MRALIQSCNHPSALLCNGCMTKELSKSLIKNGVSVNETSHITREIRRVLEENPGEGRFVCISCNENLASLCPICYSANVKRIMYSHLPKGFSDKLFSLNQN